MSDTIGNEQIGDTDKDFESIDIIKPEFIKMPNYDYWRSQEGLDYRRLRNKPTWWLYASMLAWNQSIPNNTDTILTGFNTKVWDTAMTATANQITITQNGNYILSAFAFAGWDTWNIVFRIMKNWVTINPHYREWNTSSLARTPSVNTMQTLVAWDILTLLFFQNSWWAQTLQSAYLVVSKL